MDAPEEGPILAALAETGWRLSDIIVTHRHADHVQAIEPLKARTGCRVVAPQKAGAAVPAVDAYVREGDTAAGRPAGPCLGDARPLRRPRLLLVRGRPGAVCRGHPLHPRLRPGAGGHYADLWNSLQRLAALPDEAQVYSGHDYVLSNGRFALAVEPDNAALRSRMAEAEAAKAEGRFLVPSTIGREKETNPFLRGANPPSRAP